MKCTCVALLVSVCVPATAFAVNATYIVIPTESQLTASGLFANVLPITAQSPGSLTTSYSGFITANRDTGLNTLQITGGTISANNSGSYKPPIGLGGALPGNYGTLTDNHFDPIDTKIDGAVRGFSFSPSTAIINAPAFFDASALSASIISGQLDWAVLTTILNTNPPHTDETGDGSTPITGNLVNTSGAASLVETPNLQTLTIPISTDLTVLVNGSPLAMHLSGTIIAVAPEPASLTLLTVPAFLMLRRKNK